MKLEYMVTRRSLTEKHTTVQVWEGRNKFIMRLLPLDSGGWRLVSYVKDPHLLYSDDQLIPLNEITSILGNKQCLIRWLDKWFDEYDSYHGLRL